MNKLKIENDELKKQNENLKKRLHLCKRKNREEKQKMLAVIRFLTGDKEDYHCIKDISDIEWNTNDVIASIIAEILIRFKKKSYSIPQSINMKYNDNEKALECWNDIIDKMIYAFQLAAHSSEIMTNDELQARNLGLQLFVDYFDSIWI